METGQLLFIVGYFSAIFAIVLGFLYVQYFKKSAPVAPQQQQAAPVARRAAAAAEPALAAEAEAKEGGGAQRRAARRGLQAMVEQAAAPIDDDELKEDDMDDIEEKLSKTAKKQIDKQRKKEEKDAVRHAEESSRKDKEQKLAAKADARKQKEVERERREKEKEEAEAKAAEEKKKKEEEQYNEWKDAFSVEDVGSVEQMTEAESQGLLQEFISYIKKKKVVVLDELAAEFNLKVQEVVDRIRALESDGSLTGVLDDRGKYIFISNEDMKSVADFIKRRGRITITEIVAESNKLIDLSGSSEPEAAS